MQGRARFDRAPPCALWVPFVYARYFSQKPVFEFLHDLKEDPDQLKNLAGDPAHAETLKKMSARCNELRERYEKAKK